MADDVANLTLEILKKLQADLAQFREAVETRFEAVDSRFDGIDSRLDGIDSRLDGIDSRLDRVDARLDEATAERAALGNRISHLDSETTRGFQLVLREVRGHRDFFMEKLRDHDRRLGRLETHEPPHA